MPGPPKLQAFQEGAEELDIVETIYSAKIKAGTVVEQNQIHAEGYVLLSLDQLRQLLKYTCELEQLDLFMIMTGCPICGHVSSKMALRKEATTAIVDFDCPECKKSQWTSTKKVINKGKRSMYQGNLDFIASAGISGIPWEVSIQSFPKWHFFLLENGGLLQNHDFLYSND